MDCRNLAIVFAPTVLRPPVEREDDMASLLGDSLHAHKLMESFIIHYEDLFGVHTPQLLLRESLSKW